VRRENAARGGGERDEPDGERPLHGAYRATPRAPVRVRT
jgi:hypothetical protein